jgi:uncharacterized delta-60 repeat protein
LLLIALPQVAIGGEPPSVAWSAREQPLLDGESSPGAGIPVHGRHSMATDSEGNVFVAGAASNGTDDDFLTMKYTPGGELLWWRTFDSGDLDQARGLAITPDGGVVVMGQSRGTDFDYRVVSYDRDGTQRWVHSYDSGVADRPYGIATDATGAAFVAGYAEGTATEDVTIFRLDPSGDRTWMKTFDGGGDESIEELEVGPSGDLFLVITSNSGANSDWFTLSFTPGGDQRWATRYDGGRSDRPYDLEVTSDGSIFVAGYSDSGRNDDAVVVSYGPGGDQRWAAIYDGGSQDHLFAVGTDASGNVVVGGQSYNGSDYDFLTISYTPSGERSWAQRYDGGVVSVGTGDLGHLLSIDPHGNIYIVGDSYNNQKNYDYVTVSYDPLGNQRWAATYDGGDTDWAEAMSFSPTGEVYVTGLSLVGESSDSVTVKYGSDGTQLWTAKEPPTKVGGDDTMGSGDPMLAKRAVGLGQDGSLYVTGTSTSSAGDAYTTVSYDDSGQRSWISQFDGGLEDHAYGLVVDEHDQAVVVGASLIDAYPEPHWDGWVVKYDRKGDQDWSARYGEFAGDYAYAVDVDDARDVYVTGRMGNGSSDDMVTMKLSERGKKLWTVRYEGGFDERGLVVDAGSDAVYVAGHSGLLINDVVLARYDRDGTQRWVKKFDLGVDETLADLEVDEAGNAYLLASSGSVVSDYVALKIAPDGSTLWSKTFDAGLTDTAADLVLGSGGRVIITGTTGTPAGRDIRTVALGSDGAQLWATTSDVKAADKASAVTLAPSGLILIVGSTATLDGAPDYLSVALNPNGGQEWVTTYDNGATDTASGVAATGELVLITGTSAGADADFFSIAYSFAS